MGWKNMRVCQVGVLVLLGLFLSFSTCKPPATVDKPASELDLKVFVIDTDATPSDGKVPVVMQFYVGGKYVELSGSASLSCNGVALTDRGLGYGERVTMVAPGGTYTFRHSRGGVNTTVSVTVPSRPVFISPTEGASVARSSSLTITYVAGSGSGVRGSAGDSSMGKSGSLQVDDGSYSGFNVSDLSAGPGRLGLTREFEGTVSGTGFASVQTEYSCGSGIHVTWL